MIDADALIKLGKAGVLDTLLEDHEVLVPGAVYEEAVTRGKTELYEDAFVLEAILEERGARVLRGPLSWGGDGSFPGAGGAGCF